MLVDLSTVANECKAKYENLENKGDLMLTPSFKSLLKKTLTDTHGGTVEVNDATTVINNNSLPHSWLWYAHTYWEFYAGISEYDEAIKEIINELNKSYPKKTINDFLKKFPSNGDGSWDWNKELKNEVLYQDFKAIVETKFSENTDKRKYLERFLSDSNWRHYNKQISRTDIIESAVKTVLKPHGIIQANVAYLPMLISAFNSSQELRTLFAEMKGTSTGPSMTGGQNIIFYGPPGTGKSTEIKRRIGDSPNVITVFHPDMQNSDFIGALKPAVDGGIVTYKFSPGPFAKALSKAYNHSDKNVYLVIEELNRAPAMAVFGELFQLLDRKEHGESEYEVDFPSDEFREWLDLETKMVNAKVKLPSNLSIYASMNTADQGVYPLDNAFRRRWDDEYIFIDWVECLKAELIIIKADGSEGKISWAILGEKINQELQDNYPEDSLLGQYWINGQDVKNSESLVPNKLLNYLWNDLLRHDEETRNAIFKSNIKTFSRVIKKNNPKGKVKKQIFSDEFLKQLYL
jgi:hypothetical protein